MEVHELAVRDAYRLQPRLLTDPRGSFFESYKRDALLEATGHTFVPTQVNYSVSQRDTVRGLHGVAIPPSQAKLVTCVRGRLLDIVVDLRLGSPTFGAHAVNLLDAAEGTAVYVAEGLVHGFRALTDDSCISYLCSTQFLPGTQINVQPFDAELKLPWGLTREQALVSAADTAAPTVAEAAAQGLLASYEDCLELYALKP